MILIFHNNHITTEVLDMQFKPIPNIQCGLIVTKTLLELSNLFSDRLLIWCDCAYIDHLNINAFQDIFHHKRILASYNPGLLEYLPEQIGYIERSFFLKIDKNVRYPTWLINSVVGGIHSSVLHLLKNELDFNCNFNYFLNSLSKRAMVEGLFCYSEPNLFKEAILQTTNTKQASTFVLFKFVKQHYKWVWVFMLSLCYLVYEKKLTFFPLLKSLFYKKINTDFPLDRISVQSSRKVVDKREIDIIIPTIGRKRYLYDVLKDLAKQTILPKNVIIVEQNPDKNATSELDYLISETWPFNIKHTFIHKTGVCNARNMALSQVESEWVFLGDDDIQFNSNLIEGIFNNLERLGNKVGTTVYLQPKEIQTYLKTAQTSIFGSGNSIVNSSLIKRIQFNTKYEFNYGEDTEFGMQLRHLGEDVIYFANIKITHLKAPIGGYRTKVKQLWDDDMIQPRPSPTIQLLNRTYFSKNQLMGYKALFFLKYFGEQSIKNPFKYFFNFNKQWERSQYWSFLIEQKEDA